MSEWRPIKTAPKDGTRIMIGGCCYGPSVRIGRWGAGAYSRIQQTYLKDWVDGQDWALDPTHWMPLPDDPPKATEE